MAAHISGRTSFSLEGWASTRRPYLDNLKVVLITAVIVLHGVLGYASTVEVWTYTELREVTLAPVTEIVLFVLVSPFGFFLMALLFLVAGLLTPSSLERKGTARFLRDRSLRLGIPFVLYVLVVQPTMTYALEHPLGDAPGSYWAEYLGAERRLDTGPLWFVGVLLIFSMGYAGWTAWAHATPSRDLPTRRITLRTLVLAAVVVAPASFTIRLVYPYGSESGITDLNFWEWPVCITAFALGITAARQGWVSAVPVRLARQCRDVTLLGALAMMTLLIIVGSLELVDDAMGGWHWAAVAFAVVDAVLTIFGAVWLLSVAQHRLDRRYRWGPRLSRSAYGAFMLQTLFLLGLAIALRPLDLPAEVKAVVVALGGVMSSYAASWLLITRVPGVARIL
ncbi:acyltransferase-like protein [Kribbella orskensis]|uniref:Acyltransferase-like protein n=1 Tax=Kribbella orskensis TaxID=2512216 RepID=A0ABY2B8T2_9ACTN|nr:MULTISPECIES: acyltransferase [Kribbella]TCN31159.1 acyltransferase-like protein [Kribbella sp. VKM Ac-2500]TCO11665.1 acyltransferase-like protein [Kribbella orskensis]